jgi:hypothetical protein
VKKKILRSVTFCHKFSPLKGPGSLCLLTLKVEVTVVEFSTFSVEAICCLIKASTGLGVD